MQVEKFNPQQEIMKLGKDFSSVATDGVQFAQESLFALQALSANEALYNAARSNIFSLRSAILNIATVGLTLNPALKLAYLVPRKGKVCLDISYMGLVKLATDSAAIRWCQAEIVKKNDTFVYNGLGKMPTHTMSPFEDRGEIVGVYCVARTSDGDFLSAVMKKEDCDAIRDRAMSKTGPWMTDYEEMAKKTVIKRASKLWPKSERLISAVDIINEHEGIDFESENNPADPPPQIDYAEKDALVKEVAEYIFKKTSTMSDAEKAQFLISAGVKSSGDLKRMSIDKLKNILAISVEPSKKITTEEIPF